MTASEAAEARARRRLRQEIEGVPAFLDDEDSRYRVWAEARVPAFDPPAWNAAPETLEERAEDRAKLSAASRVRDRGEIDLRRGTAKYLGVACPGCRACGEAMDDEGFGTRR